MDIAFAAISAASISGSEQKFLRRFALEQFFAAVRGEGAIGPLSGMEFVLAEAAQATGKMWTAVQLQRELAAAGEKPLCRRLERLVRGRRVAAHPDVALPGAVAAALRGRSTGCAPVQCEYFDLTCAMDGHAEEVLVETGAKDDCEEDDIVATCNLEL